MKKLLLLLMFLCFTTIEAQYNQSAPWMKELNLSRRQNNTEVTFQEIVEAFNIYWETRDPNKKGSGYKPFKRWEHYWKNFVKKDGTLPTQKELWDTYLQKQKRKRSRGTAADNSNWQPKGPFTHTNTGSWSSGQGRINCIIVDPNVSTTYYCGAPAGGLWKSTDSGSTWNILTDDLPQIGVSGIAINHADSNTIYIATGDDDGGNTPSVGVWKSEDGGSTWNPTGLNPDNSPFLMNDIYIHPTNSNILWVATTDGVYKTTNAGVSWALASLDSSYEEIYDIKLKPGNPNIIYAVTETEFFKSIDGGSSFSMIEGTGLPVSSGRLVIDVTPANPDMVYVFSATTNLEFQGIYRSTDSGANFTSMATLQSVGDIFDGSGQAWFDMALGVSDTDANVIYTGVLNIWKSTDGGTTMTKINSWSQPSTPSYTHADIHFLRFYNGKLFAGTDGGFYMTSDGGTNFSDLSAGMQIGQFYKIAVSKQSSAKIMGGLQDNGGYALNNGQWQNYYGADGMDAAIDPINSNLYFGFIQQGDAMYISDDAGASQKRYVLKPEAESGVWVTPLGVNSEGEIYAGYTELYKLCGSNFVPLATSSSSDFGMISFIEIDELNPDNIYLSSDDFSLYKSEDRGVTFNEICYLNEVVTSIEVNESNSDIIYLTTLVPPEKGSDDVITKVLKSIDGGLSFSDITGSLPPVTKNIIKHQNFHSKNPLYLGTSLGVYRYDDTVGDWEAFDNGLPNVYVTDLEINYEDSNITASTYGRGVWQSAIEVETHSNELELRSLQGLDTSISCEELSTLKVEVKNRGTNSINSIEVQYSLDGGVNQSFEWTGDLSAGSTTLIDMPTITASAGLHNLEVTTSVNGDSYTSNNRHKRNLYLNNAGTINVNNSFETAEDELVEFYDGGRCTGSWTRGEATGSTLQTPGNTVYGNSLSGGYFINTKSYLFTDCYDFTQVSSPTIKFDLAFDLLEDLDIFYVEYSTDGGVNWSVLGTSTDPNWYNSNTSAGEFCYNCTGAQWTGTNAVLTEYSHDLSALSGESSVVFRFVFHSDEFSGNPYDGVIIDNLSINGTLSSGDFTKNSFSIYPNPSNHIFNIKMLDGLNEFEFEVFDITGKTVISKTKVNPTQDTYRLDMSNYSTGIYLLAIETQGSFIAKRLIKK